MDGQDVDEQEKMLLKNEIESNTDLTHSQQTAALLALSTCKVMRQLEELRDAVFHRFQSSKISIECNCNFCSSMRQFKVTRCSSTNNSLNFLTR